jgi:hypothetical protein
MKETPVFIIVLLCLCSLMFPINEHSHDIFRYASCNFRSRPALGSTQPPIQRVLGALSPGVKRPGRQADHSPPTSAKVKKMWIYTFTPPYAFMA